MTDSGAAQRQIDIIQRQEQDRIRRDQEKSINRTDRVDGLDANKFLPKIDVPKIGAVCREIKTININGSTLLSDSVRKSVVDEFVNRCVSANDVENLLAKITKLYIDRGFVAARAYLPPQDLSAGYLEVLIVEGVVEEISIEDGGAKSVSILNAFPGVKGRILNLRDLEQGIDQINRLASNNAQLDIQPGDKSGASRVLVRNKPGFPFHFNISTDNQGSESTGVVQTGLTITADNLLGFDEMVSATHRVSTPGDYSRKYSGSDSLNFSLPFGYTTLSLGGSQSRYASVIRVPSGIELIASGTNKTGNFRLDRVMYRDQASRASLAATITTKKSENYLNQQFLGVSSRNLTVFDLDGSFNTTFGGSVLTLDFGYAQGLDIMGALRDPDRLPDWAARAQFGKFKAGFNFVRSFSLFDKNASFTSQFVGQRANNTLYGSEQIAIGGIYSVRGFEKNTLSGDNGYYWRNEISVRQPLVIGDDAIATRFYLGYDAGRVSNRTANIPGGRMTGMAIGMSVNWRGATWDFFNTRPLSLPSNMTKESSQTWFRVAYSF